MSAGEPALLVLHHEHRRQVGTEVGVDHHLDGDPAVDEQSRPHACAHLEPILRLVGGVHRLGIDVSEMAVAGIADVDRPGSSGDERRRKLCIEAEAFPRQRRLHLGEPDGLGGGVPERVGRPDGQEPVVPGDELDTACGVSIVSEPLLT